MISWFARKVAGALALVLLAACGPEMTGPVPAISPSHVAAIEGFEGAFYLEGLSNEPTPVVVTPLSPGRMLLTVVSRLEDMASAVEDDGASTQDCIADGQTRSYFAASCMYLHVVDIPDNALASFYPFIFGAPQRTHLLVAEGATRDTTVVSYYFGLTAMTDGSWSVTDLGLRESTETLDFTRMRQDAAARHGVTLDDDGAFALSQPLDSGALRALFSDPEFLRSVDPAPMLRFAPITDPAENRRVTALAATAALPVPSRAPVVEVAQTEPEGGRYALVIGNAAYDELADLSKSMADARDYAALFERKGYSVTLGLDMSNDDMRIAVAEFAAQLNPGDTAVFVFAGHGWSDGQQNFLIGTDTPLRASEPMVAALSVPLQNGVNGVLDVLTRRGAGMKVAIIDACRDNPFASQGRNAYSGGLAAATNASGTFLVFSAGAGQRALDALGPDDPHPNSVFTRIFLPLLEQDHTLTTAANIAQQRVFDLAQQISWTQEPAYYDGVRGPDCLVGKCVQ